MQQQKYNKIITGEFHWGGNLEKLVQHTVVKVLPPTVDVRGKKLNAKIVIESCLMDKYSKQERDHFSIRIQSIGEWFALFTALVLAVRVYAKMTPLSPGYVYEKVIRKFNEIWQGQYDQMIR